MERDRDKTRDRYVVWVLVVIAGVIFLAELLFGGPLSMAGLAAMMAIATLVMFRSVFRRS